MSECLFCLSSCRLVVSVGWWLVGSFAVISYKYIPFEVFIYYRVKRDRQTYIGEKNRRYHGCFTVDGMVRVPSFCCSRTELGRRDARNFMRCIKRHQPLSCVFVREGERERGGKGKEVRQLAVCLLPSGLVGYVSNQRPLTWVRVWGRGPALSPARRFYTAHRLGGGLGVAWFCVACVAFILSLPAVFGNERVN